MSLPQPDAWSARRSAKFWGDLILKLRDEQGVTQRGLSVAAQVNRSTLRGIERGEKPGDMDIMERLLGVLGYELDAIEVAATAQEKSSCLVAH
jgi:transcriptional regulator with XRE-family HTH domain